MPPPFGPPSFGPPWGRGAVRIAAVLAALGAFAGAAPAGAGGEEAREREWRHVRAVYFGARAESASAAGRVSRWESPPALSLHGAGPEDRAYVAAAVAAFNRAIGGPLIRIEESRPRSAATIRLFFAGRDEAAALAARQGIRVSLALLGAGYTEARLGAAHELLSAVSVVRDELAGDERRATVVHELYHALGPGGHSPWIPASVVFGDGETGSFATALAPVDAKALRLLYRHLRSGDDEAAARAAFDAHWSSLGSPPDSPLIGD